MFTKKQISIVSAVLVGSAALAAAPANAATTQVRQADFIPALTGTRSTGGFDFLREGLRVFTTDAANPSSSQNKSAEYFAASGSIPTSASYDWYGTSGQPGSQIQFTTGATPTTANSGILVGEQLYSTNAAGQPLTDFSLSGGSAKAAGLGLSCPSMTGGFGSDCHGTLQQWNAAAPDAQVFALGFSLGSGVKGDGVLRSQTYGDTTYEFTDQAAASPAAGTTAGTVAITAPARVNTTLGRVKLTAVKRFVRIKVSTDSLAAGTVEGTPIKFKVTVDNKKTFQTKLKAGQSARARARFEPGTGKHVIKVLQNGKVVKKVRVTA